MSWQEYIDKSLLGSGSLDKAAIFSAAGDSVWAASSGFTVAPKEMQAIVDAYADQGNKDTGIKEVQSTGLHVANDRYVVLKADERSLYGKKGKEGVIIVKTQQTILVAHYPENVQPGEAAKVVEQLGDYLLSVGY